MNTPLDRVPMGVVEALANSSVTIVGLGSVGSYIAECFARTGLASITLIDDDCVEESNLSRTVYAKSDIGRLKTEALKDRLLSISDIDVMLVSSKLQEISGEHLSTLIESSTLVIAATDDPSAQFKINSCTRYSNTPAIYTGLYKGANGGEIVISVPKITPCFSCSIGTSRTNEPSQRGDTNYGTGRLEGEIALGCDINFLSSAALKCSLSLICALKMPNSDLGNLVIKALTKGQNFIGIGMTNDFWFFPDIFEDTAAQWAFQSVWLSTNTNPSCLICGDTEQEDPYQIIGVTPSLDQF